MRDASVWKMTDDFERVSILIITRDAKQQLIRQLDSFYGIESFEAAAIDSVYETVLESLAAIFKHVSNKFYHEGGVARFNPLHVGQWTMFLYLIARKLYLESPDNIDLCDKIYGLSKSVSSADIYYKNKMPNIWMIDHPQGSVMGTAEYSDFFYFMQGCSVGKNRGKSPRLGKNVAMLSGAKVLGDCTIGDYVIFAANSYVIDEDIPSHSIVFGQSPNITIKHIDKEKYRDIVKAIWYKSDEDEE